MTDREYVIARNELIPSAAQVADFRHGKHAPLNDKDSWYEAWNIAFLGEMDRLALESGLTS